MEFARIEDFKHGWFIGDFLPSILRTADFEVCFKELPTGTSEALAVQNCSEEVTLVISGIIQVNHREFSAGDIIRIRPGEPADLIVLDNARLVGVKTPSLPNDKRLI